jgi:hypothetical protein
VTVLHGVSRAILIGFAALLFLAGLAGLIGGGPRGDPLILLVIGATGVVILLFERTRYRSAATDRHGEPAGPGGGEPSGALDPRFERTNEVFVDPTSGRRMRVHLDSRTGERRYRAED